MSAPVETDQPAEGATEVPPPSQEQPRHHPWRLARVVVGVAAGYLATRALGVHVVLAELIRTGAGGRYPADQQLLSALIQWDSGFFLDIAENGYGAADGTRPDGTPAIRRIAFFPGYPLLIRAFAHIPGLSYEYAALLASTLAGIAAAVFLYLLIERLHDATAAAFTVVLWAAAPMSIVLSMAYSEALFCAVSFAALLAAQRRSWLLAGVLGFLAGMVRSQGLATAGALVLTATWWWWRNRRSVGFGQGLRAIGGSAVSLLGVPLYIVLTGVRVGDLGAWFEQQRIGWGSQWDWGRTTPAQVWQSLSTPSDFYSVFSAMIVLIAVVLVGVAFAQRLWPGLVFFGALTVAQTVGSSVYLQSKPRLLVPALTLVVPVAVALSRTRPPVRVLALAAIVMFGLWFGAASITLWGYVI